MKEKKLIDEKAANNSPHFEPDGWQDWPEHPWLFYQFRRALGESQEGGGSVSESFLAASRMWPIDKERGVDVTLRLVQEGETGAEHCQHDNPTLSQDIIGDWLADHFNIRQPHRQTVNATEA